MSIGIVELFPESLSMYADKGSIIYNNKPVFWVEKKQENDCNTLLLNSHYIDVLKFMSIPIQIIIRIVLY